jgi:hypothetical protein
MSARRRLENRRLAETFGLECSGLKFVCTVGHFPDGSVGEIFLTNHRVSSHAGIMASDQLCSRVCVYSSDARSKQCARP